MAHWRSIRWLVTLIVLVLLVLPTLRDRDGLPFSTYPMYAHTRTGDAVFIGVEAFDSAGRQVSLSMRQIADTRDPLVAQSLLNDIARAGNADTFCREVAGRVGDSVAEIHVVEEVHDLVARTRREPSVRDRSVLATCGMP